MRLIQGLLSTGLFFLGCGAQAPPTMSWPKEPTELVLPLAEAWHPQRLLVDIEIQGHSLLFLVNPGEALHGLTPAAVEGLGLSVMGNPARGRPWVKVALKAGGVQLPAQRFEVLRDALPSLAGRMVAGVLGAALVEGGSLHLKNAQLILRRPPPAFGGTAVEHRASGWAVPVVVNEETLYLQINTALPYSALRSTVFERLSLKERPTVKVDGQSLRLHAAAMPWLPTAFDGMIGMDLLGIHPWVLDDTRKRLSIGTATLRSVDQRVARFAKHPDCGPKLARCVAGEITAVKPGRARLRFELPEVFLEDHWVRINIGLPGHPLSVLVKLHPPQLGGSLTATVDQPNIRPDTVRPPGSPIEVVDLVPIAAPCPGQVCLR